MQQYPAPPPYLLQPELELLLLRARRRRKGSMHPPHMLREEILAVEIIPAAALARDRGLPTVAAPSAV